MGVYESLIIEAKDIEIIEKHFKSNSKGLCDGNIIGISAWLQTDAEKACVLAEEFLKNALAYYNGKYGISKRAGNHQISFDPLGVAYIF